MLDKHLDSTLRNLIKEKIKSAGPISFRDFMAEALYHANLGYYASDETEIGTGGDFFTSPHLHPAFGAMVGKQIAEMWHSMGKPRDFTILEIGGGKGYLAYDVLSSLKGNEFFDSMSYVIVERNPFVKAKQVELLLQFKGKVRWAASLEELDTFRGCVLSNELIDAFPVHMVKINAGGSHEVFVDENFNEILMPADEKIKQYLTEFAPSLIDRIAEAKNEAHNEACTTSFRLARNLPPFEALGEALPNGYTTEVNLDTVEFMDRISSIMEHGFIFTIDYGYPAYEYYSPHRSKGTLLCYYRHEVSENPYEKIGHQDITAHVNFSDLKELGDTCGFKTIGYCPQGVFLVSMRIDEYLMTLADKEDYQFDALKVKRLLLPEGMGETHKVLIQYKGEGTPVLSGFSMRNMAHTLELR